MAQLDETILSPQLRPYLAASTTRHVQVGLALVLLAGVWLLARPYIGLRHDGILYLGQALMRSSNSGLSHDLFFAFGSQDSFSVFSPLVSRLYASFGVASTQVVILHTCHAAFVAACWFLLRPLPAIPNRWLGLFAMACMSHYYGSMGVFSFTETFVTARTLAEPLIVFGLGFLVSGRRLAAAVLFALALALHPLLTVPALLIFWFWLIGRSRIWLLPGLFLIVLVAILAVQGIEPFGRLIKSYDNEWAAIIAVSNRNVFVGQWPAQYWYAPIFDGAVLVAVSRWLPNSLNRVVRAAVIAAVLLTGVSYLGADIFGNVLVTQLQLWRALWITHLIAVMLLPTLVLHLWQRDPPSRPIALAVLLLALGIDLEWPLNWAFVLWLALMVFLRKFNVALTTFANRAVLGCSLVAMVGISVAVAFRTSGELMRVGAVIDIPMLLWIGFRSPALVFGLVAASYWAWMSHRALLRTTVAATTVAVCAVAISHWDRRTLWVKAIENGATLEHPFSKLIPVDAQVFWPDDLAATWGLLRRAEYFHPFQGSGLLFSRQTAIEFAKRQGVVAPFGLQRQLCSLLGQLSENVNESKDCDPDIELVTDVCHAVDGPQYVILYTNLGKGLVGEWAFPSDKSVKRLYLHSCQQLVAR